MLQYHKSSRRGWNAILTMIFLSTSTQSIYYFGRTKKNYKRDKTSTGTTVDGVSIIKLTQLTKSVLNGSSALVKEV